MTVEMVPRDQLQACAAANRHLRDEIARVEGERDAAMLVVRRAQVVVAAAGRYAPDGIPVSPAARHLYDALAPFRKDGQ